MSYNIKELIGNNLLEELIHDFYKFTHVPISIVNINGEVIDSAGWMSACSNIGCNYQEFQNLCLKEYWKNNDTCLQSEREISCICGLNMFRIPVYIIDSVIANIFLCDIKEEKTYNNVSEATESSEYGKSGVLQLNSKDFNKLIDFIERNIHLISDFLSRQMKGHEIGHKLLDNYAEMKISYDKLVAVNNELKFNLWELQQRINKEESFRKLKITPVEKKNFMNTVTALGLLVEKRDTYTARHQRRVAYLACRIATKIKLERERFEGLYVAAMLHDIGKIGIPAEILAKPDKLTDAEFELIKTHVAIAYEILSKIGFPWPVADIVLQHHEKVDGTGYPNGLFGKDILLEAKIISVADVVEAITAHRPYKPALGITYALEEIKKYSGTYYDPEIVDICIQVCTDMNWDIIYQDKLHG
ncbi:HD domain-containing protein [Anaerocolumna sedimenticola]|uniref:HD domain-containing protein n=1 Tax=Anaerocolumna sedimenticola TaxID=2696063 RepID=A0A6P1TK74_9FIRM|nr:HD domain-containing phosphohydrolase [Anaerocolumna sedimenticola]QHQ60045.1 HD domain-containing protein [Anaerocolumna sedimenticola]